MIQLITCHSAPKAKVDASASKPKSSSQPVKKTMLVGKASGKRTLADAMDYDIAARKKQRDKSLSPTKPKAFGQSRFFAGITAGPSASAIKEYQGAPVAGSSRKRAPVGIAAGASASAIKEYGDTPVAGPSRIRAPTAGPSRIQEPIDVDKENVPISDDDEDFDFVMIKPEDPVTQEDGYMSPSPSLVRLNTPDLSSPLRPGVSRKRTPGDDLDDFDVDPFSSPAAHRIAPLLRPPIRRLELSRKDSTASNSTPPDIPDVGNQGPDLRDMFSDDQTSDIDCFEDDDKPTVAPDEGGRTGADESFELDLDNAAAAMAREEVVAQGWWEKWGHSGKDREGRFHVNFHYLHLPLITDTDMFMSFSDLLWLGGRLMLLLQAGILPFGLQSSQHQQSFARRRGYQIAVPRQETAWSSSRMGRIHRNGS